MSYPSISFLQKVALVAAFVLFAKPVLAQDRDHERGEHRGRRHGEHGRVQRDRDDDEDDNDEFDNERDDDDDDEDDRGGVRGARQCIDINGDGVCDVGNSRAASRSRRGHSRNSDVLLGRRGSVVLPSQIQLSRLLRQLGLTLR